MKLYLIMLYGYPVAVCTTAESVCDIKAKLIDEEELEGDDVDCIDVIDIESDVLIEDGI